VKNYETQCRYQDHLTKFNVLMQLKIPSSEDH